MMESQAFEIEVYGLTLRGQRWGDEGAPPMLALHGWLDNAATFQRLAPLLVEAGYSVWALDLAGHGRSEHRSPDARYLYVSYVIDVVAAVDALGFSELRLIGHSMGAGVGLMSASSLGERVAEVFLIEGLGPMTTPASEAAAKFREAAESHARVRTRTRGTYTRRADAIVRKSEAIGLSPELAEPIVERSLVEVDGGWQFGDDPRLRGRSFIRFTEPQVHSFFEAVTAPVRLVKASDGLAYPAEIAAARLACLSNVAVEEVGGGHHIHLESPRLVAAALGLAP